MVSRRPRRRSIRLEAGSVTHVGRIRDVNQDDVVYTDDVFVVADGMGGHRGGEVASTVATVAADRLPALLADPDPSVVEVACWAAGENPDLADVLVNPVVTVAGIGPDSDRPGHQDHLCREAAVAALGALGHASGRPSVLAGLTQRATIRRRAVLALAAFEGDDVEAALTEALGDRDWQVRQAAEDLLGVDPDPG